MVEILDPSGVGVIHHWNEKWLKPVSMTEAGLLAAAEAGL